MVWLNAVLCAHLGGDKDRIRKSIILGSMVPLVMFLLWDAVALCLVPVSGSQDSVDFLVRCSPSSTLLLQLFWLKVNMTKYRCGLTVENTLYDTEAIFILMQTDS